MKTSIFAFVLAIILHQSGFSQELKVGYKQEGKASYYADKFNNKKTASGEKFDMYAYTAAHPKIPFNSIVKITNKGNGKWVTVRINDRGPFTPRRILDMSKAAAIRLDIIKAGIADIELEILKLPGENGEAGLEEKKQEEVASEKNSNQSKSSSQKTAEAKEDKPQKVVVIPKDASRTSSEKPTKEKTKPKKVTTNTTATTKKTSSSTNSAKAKKTEVAISAVKLEDRFTEVGTYNIWGTKRMPKGYGIQLGSYNEINKALQVGNEAGGLGMKEVYIQSGWVDGKKVYRVLFASGNDQEKVKQLLPVVKSKGFPTAFIRSHYSSKN